MVLTSHTYQESTKKDDYSKRRQKRDGDAYGLTNLLLIINNWGFVRDTQHSDKVRECTPADFQIQLKLASTAFKNPSNPEAEFSFDKQAANFPYESFLQLMKNAGLKKFLQEIKDLYVKTEGPLDIDLDEDNLASGVAESQSKKYSQLFEDSTDDEESVVTIRGVGKKRGPTIEDEDEELAPPIINSRKRGKRCHTQQRSPHPLI